MGQAQSQDNDEPMTPASSRTMSRAQTPQSPSDIITDDLHHLNGRLANFLSDIGAIEAEREKLESDLAKERELQRSMLDDVKARADREIAALKKFADELRQQLDDAKDNYKRDQANWNARLNSAHAAHQAELARQRADMQRRHAAELQQAADAAEANAERANHRVAKELEAARASLDDALVEIDRLKKQPTNDPKIARELADTRRQNADLQRSLAVAESALADASTKAQQVIQKKDDDLKRSKNLLAEKQIALSDLEHSYAIVSKEVAMYRRLLDTEVPRITPSKKRKLNSGSSFEPSTPSPASPVRAQRTPGTLSRRSTMEQVREDAAQFLEDGAGDVRISACDAEGEVVSICNHGKKAVSIAGYRLIAEKAKKEFKFAPRTTLAPNHTVRVHSGKGAQDIDEDDDNLVWTDRPVWSEKGDEPVLRNASNKRVSHWVV